MLSPSAETSPLLGRRFAVGLDANCSSLEEDLAPIAPSPNERRKNTIGTLFLHAGKSDVEFYFVCYEYMDHAVSFPYCLSPISAACILVGYLLNTSYSPISNRHGTAAYEDSILASFGSPVRESSKSPYTKVQTLSFQIYTGGAPAYITDASTGKVRHNPECVGCKLICFCSLAGGSKNQVRLRSNPTSLKIFLCLSSNSALLWTLG